MQQDPGHQHVNLMDLEPLARAVTTGEPVQPRTDDERRALIRIYTYAAAVGQHANPAAALACQARADALRAELA
ncbi:hypothetical protein [Kitasatospora griseola]|uniref:hypothetical protein n=1 Tax=Kitasatospora griseola TaxID=2064 RepID=UPI00365B67E9